MISKIEFMLLLPLKLLTVSETLEFYTFILVLSWKIMPKLVKTQAGKARPLVRNHDFRVISWNIEDFMSRGALEGDQEKVNNLLNEVNAHSNGRGANVICLQELHWSTFNILERRLKESKKNWRCFFDWKEKSRSKLSNKITAIPKFSDQYGLAICVLGRGSNFKWKYFTEPNGKPWLDKGRRYIQIDYKGVKITCVHTQAWRGRNTRHITELHKKVTSGIIAGDFNNPHPDKPNPPNWPDPGWQRTELSKTPTRKRSKIDHIIAINTPSYYDGEVRDEFGSDHRLIWGSITFPKVGIKRPKTKKPIPIKPIRKISLKKTKIDKKKTTRKSATKKITAKKIVSRKIMRRVIK